MNWIVNNQNGNRTGPRFRLPGPFLSLALVLGFVFLTLVAFYLAGGRERGAETGYLSEKFGFAPDDCPTGQVVPLYGVDPASDDIAYSDSIDFEDVDESDSSSFLLCGTETNTVIEPYLGGGALAGFGFSVLLFVVRAGQWVIRSPEGRRGILTRVLAMSGLLFLSSVLLFYSSVLMLTLEFGILSSSSNNDVFDTATLVYALSGLLSLGTSIFLFPVAAMFKAMRSEASE